MDKKYVDLFKELTRATAVTSEQVMDYDHENNNTEGFDTAKMMRDDYEALHDRLEEDYKLTKDDVIKLLLGAMIQAHHIENRIAALRKAMTGYQTVLLPKLQEIVDNAETDEDVAKLAEEKFNS